jgi:beta-glucosidase
MEVFVMIKKRVLAILTAIALVATPVTPMSAFAAEPDDYALLDATMQPTRPDFPFRDQSLDPGVRINDLVSRMTPAEIVSGGGSSTRLGVNGARGGGGEGLHGVAWDGRATVFPNSLGLSQTWDQELMAEIGDVIAVESLALGGMSRLTPVVDLLRDPRYGRAYETLGEDAYLTGSLATSMADAMVARDDGYIRFKPTLKHFFAYNAEINRLWVASPITPRTTQEYYIKAFKYPVEAGAAKSLMNSYPVVNGKPMSVHPMQDQLLNVWTPDFKSKADGGDGATGHYEFTTTNDYGSGSSVAVHSQRYFPDTLDGRALAMSEGIKNGQQGWSFRDWGGAGGAQNEGLALGMASLSDYEEYAKRNLAMSVRDGSMDYQEIKNPYLAPAYITSLGDRESNIQRHKDVAYQASLEQITLLKNDGILPLDGTTNEVVLLGPLSDQILKDFYSGNYEYRITIKDALINKLGASKVHFNRAIDSVAIKANNGKYLSTPNNSYSAVGLAKTTDTAITASLSAKPADVSQKDGLFEIYDYGSTIKLLRTPINGRYVQINRGVNNGAPVAVHPFAMLNNTSAPAEGNINEFAASGQNLNFTNFTSFRIVDHPSGGKAIYNLIAGDGTNGGTGYAYDVDDEDTNRGSFVKAVGEATVVADISTNGPYQDETHTDGPSITNSELGNLSDDFKFTFEDVQTAEEAIDDTLAATTDPDAPIILVVGYEPHVNAREAIDLYETGLSDQQMRMIDHITDPNGLNKELILILKAGNPMVIDSSVQDNPNVKAIVNIGQSGQEEGSALVSALFDDGYEVPNTGWEPQKEYCNEGTPYQRTYTAYPGYKPSAGFPAYSPAGRLSATWYDGVSQMIGASEDHPPASYVYPDYSETANDNFSNMNGSINTGLLVYDIIKGERTYQYLDDVPLYAFGYGLSYTDFDYLDVAVSTISGGKFTVTGKVKNTGTVKSDEVVQIYSSFAGTASRIIQPKQKLIAYDRIKDIAPGEEKSFQFTIDMTDKMGVWDVEAGRLIVEPGDYTIKAAGSSDAAGDTATLTVSGSNGGVAAAVRNLGKLTYAYDFDDYSNVGGRVDDIEPVSSSIAYESSTAVQFRKDGAWINFKNVNFATAPTKLTISVGSDRTGKLEIHSGSENGTLVGEVPLTDTRSTPGLPTGLGIGPKGV